MPPKTQSPECGASSAEAITFTASLSWRQKESFPEPVRCLPAASLTDPGCQGDPLSPPLRAHAPARGTSPRDPSLFSRSLQTRGRTGATLPEQLRGLKSPQRVACMGIC